MHYNIIKYILKLLTKNIFFKKSLDKMNEKNICSTNKMYVKFNIC